VDERAHFGQPLYRRNEVAREVVAAEPSRPSARHAHHLPHCVECLLQGGGRGVPQRVSDVVGEFSAARLMDVVETERVDGHVAQVLEEVEETEGARLCQTVRALKRMSSPWLGVRRKETPSSGPAISTVGSRRQRPTSGRDANCSSAATPRTWQGQAVGPRLVPEALMAFSRGVVSVLGVRVAVTRPATAVPVVVVLRVVEEIESHSCSNRREGGNSRIRRS